MEESSGEEGGVGDAALLDSGPHEVDEWMATTLMESKEFLDSIGANDPGPPAPDPPDDSALWVHLGSSVNDKVRTIDQPPRHHDDPPRGTTQAEAWLNETEQALPPLEPWQLEPWPNETDLPLIAALPPPRDAILLQHPDWIDHILPDLRYVYPNTSERDLRSFARSMVRNLQDYCRASKSTPSDGKAAPIECHEYDLNEFKTMFRLSLPYQSKHTKHRVSLLMPSRSHKVIVDANVDFDIGIDNDFMGAKGHHDDFVAETALPSFASKTHEPSSSAANGATSPKGGQQAPRTPGGYKCRICGFPKKMHDTFPGKTCPEEIRLDDGTIKRKARDVETQTIESTLNHPRSRDDDDEPAPKRICVSKRGSSSILKKWT